MDEEKNLNTAPQEQPRRRRRSEMHQATADNAAEDSLVHTADNRVPPEARRMAASPYGTDRAAAARRPGTRLPQAVRRPVQEPRRIAPEPRRTVPEIRQAGSFSDEAEQEGTRSFDSSRISVGYAPGQMVRNARTAQAARNAREAYGREIYSREAHERNMADPRTIRNIQEDRYGYRLPEDRDPPQSDRHPALWAVTALLLAIGLAAVILLSLPKNDSIRKQASEAVGKITAPLENLLAQKNIEPARIDAFTVTGNEKTTAPTDVIFSVTTDRSVNSLRLVDEDGGEVAADMTLVENTDNNCWTLTLRVRDGYEGLVELQTKRERENWMSTDYSAILEIAPPLAGGETAVPEEIPETEAAEEPGEEPDGEDGEASGEIPEGEPEEPAGEADSAEETMTEEVGATQEDYGDDLWGIPWGGTPTPDPNELPEETPALTDTPEPTPEPTPTPPLTATADPDASPDLITTTIIYDGSKKQKEYMRAAKALIHMPDGDDYTMKKIGVLTFRGNAFRQNAAVGEVESASELTEIWQVEAGSSRGASQTFYGYEWTGQPAIVKWSTQVRAASNIDEEKKSKSALREVIIAGVDGVIRFIDLEDGTLTRSAINLGYPMKGTPSLHPAGYPYMNVGQYTRKMKVKTGKIGLRQYNLYNQKELNLIDGLDGKMHRGINKYGSFETSSLIDRTSDTMITLGTNGLLYLTSLNTEFDYQAGTLKVTPGSIVMASRAKGEKKDEMVAVESSHAMYDRYVFYADMGGILRCVDTNYLKPVWAVNTGDAVMAAVALDLNGTDGLDLYTANMLSNRKKGGAQIRRYDALSGKEIWTVEIGVAKNTKTKEDVGVKASPVIGQKDLDDLVFFTVTGLDAEGRSLLGVSEDTKAALVALDKDSGTIRWVKGLSDRSESSPVAVYDKEGHGWIIQCAEDGTILLLEGRTGEQQAELQVEGKIKASPAVYNDIMVIGTTGKGTEFVYGIRIR